MAPQQQEETAAMQHSEHQTEHEVEFVYSVPEKVVHQFLNPWGRCTFSKTSA